MSPLSLVVSVVHCLKAGGDTGKCSHFLVFVFSLIIWFCVVCSFTLLNFFFHLEVFGFFVFFPET